MNIAEYNFTEAWTNPNLVNIYRQIEADCQGKSSCTGRVPLAGQLSAQLPEGSAEGICGWEEVEYVAKLVITTECVGEFGEHPLE